MRYLPLVVLLALTVAPRAAAQSPRPELGTMFGLTVGIPDEGDTEVFLGLPGASSLFDMPTLFLTLFPTERLLIEPQLGLAWNSISEDVAVSGALQAGFLLGPATGAPYVFATGGIVAQGDFDSGLAGLGFGYRLREGGFVFRSEVRFRRWLCEGCDLNEMGLRVGLGAALP